MAEAILQKSEALKPDHLQPIVNSDHWEALETGAWENPRKSTVTEVLKLAHHQFNMIT